MRLDQVEKQKIVKIKKIHDSGAFKRRMLEMGLVTGREIVIQKFAPLGNPMEIKLDGQSISIRNEEAHLIEVGEINE